MSTPEPMSAHEKAYIRQILAEVEGGQYEGRAARLRQWCVRYVRALLLEVSRQEEENGILRSKVQAVQSRHRKVTEETDPGEWGDYCNDCSAMWPCETARDLELDLPMPLREGGLSQQEPCEAVGEDVPAG